MSVYEAEEILYNLGVSEQTLAIVCAINGTTIETMCDILYAHTGYRSFDQLED